MSGESENIQAVLRLYEAFNETGVAGAYEHWDPDIEWHDIAELPDARVHQGRDAAAKALQAYVDLGGEFEVAVEEFIDAGDEVVAIWRYRGRGAGSGVPIEQPVFHVWLVQDQRLLRLRQFISRERAFEAAGLRE
jgi:ketosteroid isomerase-like protein